MDRFGIVQRALENRRKTDMHNLRLIKKLYNKGEVEALQRLEILK